KIVMFSDAYWPRVNGVTVSVDSFSKELIRLGHEVVIICSFYPESQAVERMSTPTMDKRENEMDPVVIRVPSYPLPISREDRLAKFHKWFWVSKQLNAFNPDIIHVNSEFVIGEFGFYYAKLHNLPVVYTFHTLWEDYAANYIPYVPEILLRRVARHIIRNMAKRADAIIAPSAEILEVLKRYKIKQETHLLPTGIDPLLFNKHPSEVEDFRRRMEEKYPLIAGKRLLLFAGRVGNEKNLSFLLRILPGIVEKHPDVLLFIAGNGPDLPRFVEEAEHLGVAEHCIFSGYLDRSDLALVYAMSELFVFPSRTETQGLVTIEAMLSGIPVVAIGEMGTVTVMGGDNGGFMVKNDPAEFSSRVCDLLGDPALYERKVEEARVHAQSWTIGTMAKRLERIYRGLISDHPKGFRK
ncbi:MAG: glycosyltransferase, partial [Spirochaetales bacterium]|nr:glycosyltransferase [Spirochaetales bacterium]